MFSRDSAAAITLAALIGIGFGSCTPVTAGSSCFQRSKPSLPTVEKVRNHLSNGEEGRRIYDAVNEGDVAAVEQLVRANPRLLATHRVLADGERPSNGNTGGLLTFAIARCDAQMVGALLELGADPDGVPPGNALTYALLADELVMATMLLQAGANPDAHARDATTPLREVLYYQRADAVQLLVQAGADVNHADAIGTTPLLAAIRFGDYVSAEALMAGGANPWLVANKGSLPAAMLQEPAKNARQEPVRQRLLEKARAQSVSWPPPATAEIVSKFASGEWPTEEMQAKGFVASPGALKTIGQVAKSSGTVR
ncbi:MAG: ankyrin repeat domain-containing protein [Pseudomonadota bacterium]|nr:ankyrin repeat domain-containing protein [Pseudomonadota bacterium]